MKLSIIIPSYNRRDRISSAIDSVLQQEGLTPDSEIIVVDDGSEDGTDSLIQRNYRQVKYIKQANRGVSAARNAGLKQAAGEWIALLDSDDRWLPHKLAAQFDLIFATGLKVCHTEEIWIRNGRRVNQMNKHKKSGGRIYLACLPLCAMSPSSIIIHRSVFDRVGLFDESLPACEDYDLWLRICAQYEVAFVEAACVEKTGGHADQLSRLHWGMDRFRVHALEKMLSNFSHTLTSGELDSTKQTLLAKLSILLQGAVKHGNGELEAHCRRRLAYWQTEAPRQEQISG